MIVGVFGGLDGSSLLDLVDHECVGAGHVNAEASALDVAMNVNAGAGLHVDAALEAVDGALVGLELIEPAFEIVVPDGARVLGHGRSVLDVRRSATIGSVRRRARSRSRRMRGLVWAWMSLGFGSVGACSEHRPDASDGPADVLAVIAQPSMRTAWPSWGGELPASDLEQEAEIRTAEVERHAEAPSLVIGLAHQDARVRARAAWAIGRVGGEQAAARLVVALEDASTPAQIAALSFLEPPRTAPGEPPEPHGVWRLVEDALWVRYAVTEETAAAEALLLAIARVGGQRSQRWLAVDTAELPGGDDERSRYRAGMQAAAIACARGHGMRRDGLRSIARGLTSNETSVRTAAAYALSRCAGPSAEALAGPERGGLVERLAPMVVASDPEESRLAWRALAGLGEIVDEVPPAILGSQPPPWMVEVEAVSALAGHADGRRVLAERLAGFTLEDIDGPRVHVLLTALRGLRRAIDGTPELLVGVQALEPRVAELPVGDVRRAKALALIGCELRFLAALRTGDIEGLSQCSGAVEGLPSDYGETLVVDALLAMGGASTREEKMNALLQRARDPRSTVAAVALTGLADLDDPRISVVLREAVQRPDAGVQAAAASAIAARSVDASRRDDTIAPVLLETLQTLDDGHAIEARLAIVEALGHLARPRPPASANTKADPAQANIRSWLEPQIAVLARQPAWAIRSAAREALLGHDDLLAHFDELQPASFPDAFAPEIASAAEATASGLRLHTEAGAITIAFDGAPAPLMQANLVRLTERGYFDGVGFHRVVPGFVVQGGDPRGDGYGGPGWLVPCEWSNLRYERGTVGVALAGKDTGGSQIFVAQAPQPHLDGRYTVVGRVSEGMEVVDRLLVHDRITKAEVLR